MVTQKQTHVSNSATANKRKTLLRGGQILTVLIIGIILWFIAALTVRFGSAAGLFEPSTSPIMFLLGFPIAWICVIATNKIAKLERSQSLPGIALGLAIATFLDGIALTWFRNLYGTDPAQIVIGAAWILWGVGLFLVAAYIISQRHINH